MERDPTRVAPTAMSFHSLRRVLEVQTLIRLLGSFVASALLLLPAEDCAQSRIPERLTATAWSGGRSALDASRHAACSVAEEHRARNPGQQWQGAIEGRGFMARSESGGWEWGLEPEHHGFAGQERVMENHECADVDGGRVDCRRDDTLRDSVDAAGSYHATLILAALFAFAVICVSYAATPNDGGLEAVDEKLKKAVVGIVGQDRARFVKDGVIRRLQRLSLDGVDAALSLKITGLFRSQKKMRFQPTHAKQILALLRRRDQASRRALQQEREALAADKQEVILAKGREYRLEAIPDDGSDNSITPAPLASGFHTDDEVRRAIRESYSTIVSDNMENIQELMAEHLNDDRFLQAALVPNKAFSRSPGILAVVGRFEHAASGITAAINVSNRLSDHLVRRTADELMIAHEYWDLGLSRYLPRPLIAHPLFIPASAGAREFLVAVTVLEWMGGDAGRPLEKLSFRTIEDHETVHDSRWYRWPNHGHDHVELAADEIGPASTEVAAAISYHALLKAGRVTTISDLMLGSGAFVYRRLPENQAEIKMVAAPSLRADVSVSKFVHDLIEVNLMPSVALPRVGVWDVETALRGLVRGRECHAVDTRDEGVDEATARAQGRDEAVTWIEAFVASPHCKSKDDAARRFLTDLDASDSLTSGPEV